MLSNNLGMTSRLNLFFETRFQGRRLKRLTEQSQKHLHRLVKGSRANSEIGENFSPEDMSENPDHLTRDLRVASSIPESLTVAWKVSNLRGATSQSSVMGSSESSQSPIRRQSRSFVPDEIGFCDEMKHTSGKQSLFIHEKENLNFAIQPELIKSGKVHLSIKLCDAMEVKQGFPAIGKVGAFNMAPDFLNHGMFLLTRRSYVMDEAPSLYNIESLNSREVFESLLTRTKIQSIDSRHGGRMRKTVTGNFLIPESHIDFRHELSVFNGAEWDGAYKESNVDPEVTQDLLDLNQSHTGVFGRPSHIMIADMLDTSGMLSGGKNIIFFHPFGVEGEAKCLVNEYNVVGLDSSNHLVKLAVRSLSSWICASTQRESGKVVDGMRRMSLNH